jgi:hypothetical protein
MQKKTLASSFQLPASVRALGLSSIALGALLTACGDSEPDAQPFTPFPSATDVQPGPGTGVAPTGSGPVIGPVAPGPVITPGGPTGAPVGPTAGPGPNPGPLPTGVTPDPTGTVPGPVGTDPGPTPVEPGPGPVTPGPSGTDPAGFWRQDDWKGCAWTGIDDTNKGTTIAPQDFTGGIDGGFCVSGKVAATEGWMGVALLGFNLNQDPAAADCKYVPVDPNAEGPPGVTLTKKGLAVDFVKRGADKTFTLRAQIQGPDGASDPNDRWCANITEAQGKELIEWADFNTECWEGGKGKAYNGEPISAVVFTVPGNGWAEGENGTASDTPFDFCINGFAAGDSAADAPDGSIAQEDLTGTIGGPGTGADFQRVKVAHNGKSYVIQNNNWGNTNGDQTLSYRNNSFKITDPPDGPATCQGCPISFPSIYIGASGNTDGGNYHTRSTDNLPLAINAISSVPSSVRWSGNPGNKANATYDIWFAKPGRGNLTGKRYNDGLDGFIMLWLHKPADERPIGNSVGQTSINNITWDVWVGPRGQGPSSDGADLIADSNAPVISYVATSTTNSFSGDLKAFFVDAQQRSGAFTADLLLTDVFFGFEIWGGGNGLAVDSFEVEVKK